MMDVRKVKTMAGKTVDEIIESLPFGRFSCMLIFLGGLIIMQGSSHNYTIGLIAPELICNWNLTLIETSVASSVVFFGMGIGSFYWGYLCDKHGRKKVLIAATLLTSYVELLSAVSPNYYLFLILRFFVGIGIGSIELTVCYVAEFINQKHRGKSVILVQLFSAFGNIYVSFIGLTFMQSTGWRWFLVIATIPSIYFLMLSKWLPESVRYLQNTEKYDELMKIFNRMSTMNNEKIAAPTISDTNSSSSRGHLKILFSKNYLYKLIIMAFVITSSHAGYQSLSMFNTELLRHRHKTSIWTSHEPRCKLLDRNDYVQNIIVTLSDIPGILLPFFTVDIFGRKKYMIPSFILAGLCFLSLDMVGSQFEAMTAVMMTLRFFMSGLNHIAHVVVVELFPTVVRASALGILSGVAKLSLIGVPFLVQALFPISPLLTLMIFAFLCLLSGVLVLFLPETRTLHLMNS